MKFIDYLFCGISCISIQSIWLANKTDIKRQERKLKNNSTQKKIENWPFQLTMSVDIWPGNYGQRLEAWLLSEG